MIRPRPLPILLTLALAIFAAPSAQTSTPSEGAPRSAAKVDEIEAWVELHKGLGSPDFLEAHVRDLHVFAAWNIPTSGLNTTYYWVYCRRGGAWTLLKASSFQPAEDQTRYARRSRQAGAALRRPEGGDLRDGLRRGLRGVAVSHLSLTPAPPARRMAVLPDLGEVLEWPNRAAC